MFAAGTRLGPYELVREIGKGGHGMVWLAVHTSLQRNVAIKVLRPELAREPELVRRFFKEARAAARVEHPGIVSIFDVGESRDDRAAYIAMELLVGESLGDALRRNGSFAISRAVALAFQIAGALAAVHAAGILHRDLKPDNVFLVPDASLPQGERIKILDFGIAKLRRQHPVDVEETDLTREGLVIGTPAYMAPEQCKGNQPLDERTDIYALGCVLFRVLTGKAPFEATSPSEIIAAHLLTLPPRVESVRGDVPPGLAELVNACLEKDPARRPRNMDEVCARLDGLRESRGRDAPTPTLPPELTRSSASEATVTRTAMAPSEPPAAPPRRRGWALAAGVLALGTGVVVAWPEGAPPAAAVLDAAVALDASLVDAGPVDAGVSRPVRAPRKAVPDAAPAFAPPPVPAVDAAPPPPPPPAGKKQIGDDSIDPFETESGRR